MKPISKEAIAYLTERMPALVSKIETITTAKSSHVGVRAVHVSLEDFGEDPFLLYSAVWYICSEGLKATVVS